MKTLRWLVVSALLSGLLLVGIPCYAATCSITDESSLELDLSYDLQGSTFSWSAPANSVTTVTITLRVDYWNGTVNQCSDSACLPALGTANINITPGYSSHALSGTNVGQQNEVGDSLIRANAPSGTVSCTYYYQETIQIRDVRTGTQLAYAIASSGNNSFNF